MPRERNWQKKYSAAMFATEPLVRLHASILKLNDANLRAIAEGATQTTPDEIRTAGRTAVNLLGISVAHDTMFLADFATEPLSDSIRHALEMAALAVAALPHGLSRDEYDVLTEAVRVAIPWIAALPTEST
jgi:hypothetical protein